MNAEGHREKDRPISAICLLSGGLDSQLAVCLLRDQGIAVHGVSFESPFFSAEPARVAAKALGMRLDVVDFTAEILAILQRPRHGFGQCMNPCIDCHAAMIRRAGRLMEETGLDFISTGEVLNERPMSQNRRSLATVAEESGYADLLLRPLSAQLLPETKPEREGRVDRSRLLALHGRKRKPQLELASRYGLKDFPTPASGCKLTEPNFCRRLKDLRDHEGLEDLQSIVRLRLGRHFRLGAGSKLIVGRNQADNKALEQGVRANERILTVVVYAGPTAILPAGASEEEVEQAAAICARYSDCPPDPWPAVTVKSGGCERRVTGVAMDPEEVERLRI